MKTKRSCQVLVVLCFFGASSSVRSQTAPIVRFANNDLFYGINAPFYHEDGTTRLAGATFRAALYYGAANSPPETWLRTTADSQPFGTGAAAGYWRSSEPRLIGFAPDARVGLQVRFWDTENGAFGTYEQAEASGGRVGVSVPIFVTTVSPPLTTPMTGLRSAALVPPPITLTRSTPKLITHSGIASGTQITNLCGVPVGPNRWFRFTSPYPGSAIIATAGSEMDTVVGAFQGSIVSPSAMTEIACNDDFAAGVTSSEVRFPVETNTLYLLCVAGKNGATNTVRLSHMLATDLQIRRTGLDRMELSWPADATNCIAEAAPGLQGAWSAITNTPSIFTNRKVLELDANPGDEKVYRLRFNAP
jgi:hypothetical protein